MSEAKYTKELWGLWSEEGRDRSGKYLFSVCRNEGGPSASGYLDITDDADTSHSCVAQVMGDTKEEAKARAHLVSAAPDLYEALKACIEALEHCESIGMKVNPPTLENAKAVIKKATP